MTAVTDARRSADLVQRRGGAQQDRARLADPAAAVSACDSELAAHRAALQAGADPEVVTGWIAETTQAGRLAAMQNLQEARQAARGSSRGEQTITELVDELGDLREALGEAGLADKRALYVRAGLALTYHPGKRQVHAEAAPASQPPQKRGVTVCVRGGT